jgi:hypothetical protein
MPLYLPSAVRRPNWLSGKNLPGILNGHPAPFLSGSLRLIDMQQGRLFALAVYQLSAIV